MLSPIRYITSHKISCCSVAFIEIKFQQKLCFNNQVPMLPSHSQRQCFKTDQVMQNAQILCLHFYSLQKGSGLNGIIFHDWGIITGVIPLSPYEPITAVDRFNVLSMKECSSAEWNAESRGNTLNMSQHCPVMVFNSKQ